MIAIDRIVTTMTPPLKPKIARRLSSRS